MKLYSIASTVILTILSISVSAQNVGSLDLRENLKVLDTDLDLIWGVLRSTSRPRFVDIAFGSGGRIGDRYSFTVPFAFGIRIVANGGN